MDKDERQNPIKQDGLEWVATTFSLEPRWTREPDITKIESLTRKHLKISPLQKDSHKKSISSQQKSSPKATTPRSLSQEPHPSEAPFSIRFYAQGALNKLYKVETESGCSLMRVTLPVDPFHKTNTKFLAFDDSSENELGFEWILMEMLPGGTLRSKWRKLSWDAKEKLVKQVAHYQAQLFGQQFSGIGNLFINSLARHTVDVPAHVEKAEQDTTNLGQIVSMIFFWGSHLTQEVSRGPFTDSAEWIRARLTLILTDQEHILANSDDEDDIEDAQDAKDIAERLLKILPEVLPPGTPERTTLFHDDLNLQNILVDDEGKITGVVDWECVSALPLWRACRVPQFLEDKDRFEEPKREQYAPDDDDDEEDADEDNEGVNGLYWEHLMEYELTQLRELFLETMKNIAPEWIEECEKAVEKADFEAAVQDCDNSWQTREIKSWLDAREKGEKWSLRKKFFE